MSESNIFAPLPNLKIMGQLENQYKDLEELLKYKEYTQLVKRIIDFTIDTGSVDYYRETSELLDWLDENLEDSDEIRVRFSQSLDALYQYLKGKERRAESQVLIVVKDMEKAYGGNSRFKLGPLSFSMKEGEIIGLVGENGNGKTTLLRVLCGELRLTGGNVEYFFPYTDNYDLRSHLIYIPQRTDVWHGSLLSNLQFAATSYGILGEENELLVQLIIARMGLRKYRNYKWKDLSSGYKMRFELARALLRKPKVLLIDEPLANLDILAQQVVLDDFRAIARSLFNPIGIVLSSQQLYEVEKNSDNVIFLKNGIPQNLIQTPTGDDSNNMSGEKQMVKFVVEFETAEPQNVIRSVFESLQLEQLQINGGTYVATFPEAITPEDFLQLSIDKKISLYYYRDISKSTRRFFLS